MIRDYIENERKKLRKLSIFEKVGEIRFNNNDEGDLMEFEGILCYIDVPYQKVELKRETILLKVI